MRLKDYKYNVGETIYTKTGSILILDQIRIIYGKNRSEKGYKYKCLNDGYEGEKREVDINKRCGCPVCASNKVMVGINDLWTTRPDIACLLHNPNDGYIYPKYSNKVAEMICPDCGNIINQQISNVSLRGLSCKQCGDGISYPAKFIFSALTQLNLKFEVEKTFDWCVFDYKGKQRIGKYDFYVENDQNQYIIEADGGWHYKNNNLSGQTKDESNFIDSQKDQLAHEHTIIVIRIPSLFSTMEDMKYTILHSRLAELFNITVIDWSICHSFAVKSLLVKVCDLWEELNDISKICNIYNLSKTTVRDYLKSGVKLNICSYDPHMQMILSAQNNRNNINYKLKKKPIICLDTITIYDSIKIAAQSNQCNASNIIQCCLGKRKTADKHYWMYYDEYIKLSNEEKQKLIAI